MGLFADKSKGAFDKAVTAVSAGIATKEQVEMATAQAKQAGERGNAAKVAFKS